jgi:inosine/xanthosine triphosphate pyrophosphatase family protein
MMEKCYTFVSSNQFKINEYQKIIDSLYPGIPIQVDFVDWNGKEIETHDEYNVAAHKAWSAAQQIPPIKLHFETSDSGIDVSFQKRVVITEDVSLNVIKDNQMFFGTNIKHALNELKQNLKEYIGLDAFFSVHFCTYNSETNKIEEMNSLMVGKIVKGVIGEPHFGFDDIFFSRTNGKKLSELKNSSENGIFPLDPRFVALRLFLEGSRIHRPMYDALKAWSGPYQPS